MIIVRNRNTEARIMKLLRLRGSISAPSANITPEQNVATSTLYIPTSVCEVQERSGTVDDANPT